MTSPVVARSITSTMDDASEGGRRTRLPLIGLVAVTVLGAVHAAAIAPHYTAGSFDDDGHYIALATALVNGLGFVDTSQPGAPVDTFVPPGYPALIAPLVALFPGEALPLRLLSLIAYLALFPMTWHWLGLRRVSDGLRLTVLVLLALNPVVGTYATMVMAEAPFLVALLLLLIAAHRWAEQRPIVTGWGLVAAAAMMALPLLKSAAIVVVPGVVGWLLLRRQLARAALMAVAGALAVLPPMIVRVATGESPLGTRYADDFSDYGGDPLGRLLTVLPDAALTFLRTALPNSVVPTETLPLTMLDQPLLGALDLLRWSVAPLVLIGFVAWQRRRLDLTLLVAPLYLLQSLAYPFVNERRVVLVLPLVLVWYVVGASVLVRLLALAASRVGALRGGHRSVSGVSSVAACAVVLAAVAPALLVQFDRNYLFGPGQDSSTPRGAPYMEVLAQAAPAGSTLTSSYRWTTSLYTGHPTVRGPFNADPCGRGSGYAARVRASIREYQLGGVLIAALNGPGMVDGGCLLPFLDRRPELAVRLYRQPLDYATAFQLIGPGTAAPDLVDATLGRAPRGSNPSLRTRSEPPFLADEPAGRYLEIDERNGAAMITVPITGPVTGQRVAVTQVSVGAAGQVGAGIAERVAVALRRPDGSWVDVAVADTDVSPLTEAGSDVAGPAYLLWQSPTPVEATAVRVAFEGAGTFELHDLHVLAGKGTT
ncbi:MAG: hypothetical protein M3467_04360 [Actinomycetota bacterium]|jgi:hypothetical protein|nr:hypothetical protein [Actinomycetota bacterium]